MERNHNKENRLDDEEENVEIDFFFEYKRQVWKNNIVNRPLLKNMLKHKQKKMELYYFLWPTTNAKQPTLLDERQPGSHIDRRTDDRTVND